MNGHPLRCGCIIHVKSDDIVGCPVLQAIRLNALVAELEKLLEVSQLVAYETGITLLASLPEDYLEEEVNDAI